ncbi:MAG TPA: DUF1697 domain-containing protein [Gaiellaceae bacterium]
MATVWVALLRGINLGGRNRVPMGELREVFEQAGCGDVRTYIQSGNVVFTSRRRSREALARLLERAVEDAFGVVAPVVLRTSDELAAVAGSHPFGRVTSHSYVSFLAADPDPAGAGRLAAIAGEDELSVVGRDVFLRYPNGFQGAQLTGPLLERHLGVAGTVRNWRTVMKLAELAAES